MKKVLSILLIVFMLTVSFASMVMAADISFTLATVDDIDEVNVGDELVLTLTNDSAITVSSLGFNQFTFNDNFIILSYGEEGGEYEDYETGVSAPSDFSLKSLNKTNGTTSASAGANASIRKGKFKATYVLQATAAGVVEINCNPVVKSFEGIVEGELSATVTPVTVTVKGSEPPVPTTYTLTYDAGAGSGAPAAETGITAGTEISLAGKTATAPAGKVFAGWTANGTDIITSIVVNDNVTLTAVYEDEPAAEKLLKGVITRLADSVTITDDTITVNYDLKQNKVNSGYVMFAPSVDDGTEVDVGGFDYRSKFATTEYTLSATSATGINIAAETGKESVEAYSLLRKAANSQSFTMTLTKGEEVETYTVNLVISDFAVADGNFGITEADIVTYRAGDVVEVSGKNINLTTKNKFNFNTLAIKVGKLGPAEGRQRPAIEVRNADANIKSVGGGDGNYSAAILFYYGSGTRSYSLRLYGGDDCLSYEDYTLNITYVPTFSDELNIWRVKGVKNATANARDDINTNREIVITSNAAGGPIQFYPIINGGVTGEFVNYGDAAVVAQDYKGRTLQKIVIDPANVPSALQYLVKYIRDSRAYDVSFNIA